MKASPLFYLECCLFVGQLLAYRGGVSGRRGMRRRPPRKKVVLSTMAPLSEEERRTEARSSGLAVLRNTGDRRYASATELVFYLFLGGTSRELVMDLQEEIGMNSPSGSLDAETVRHIASLVPGEQAKSLPLPARMALAAISKEERMR